MRKTARRGDILISRSRNMNFSDGWFGICMTTDPYLCAYPYTGGKGTIKRMDNESYHEWEVMPLPLPLRLCAIMIQTWLLLTNWS